MQADSDLPVNKRSGGIELKPDRDEQEKRKKQNDRSQAAAYIYPALEYPVAVHGKNADALFEACTDFREKTGRRRHGSGDWRKSVRPGCNVTPGRTYVLHPAGHFLFPFR